MVGLCGPKTRDRANVVLRESLTVLPSLVCLFMPSYFTSYGVIWSSLLVPAANSARANKAGEGVGRDRWLKYWCVYAVLACVLELFGGVLRWVPFSTHGVLLLSIGVSLPGLGLCEALFQFVVNEAVGLGLVTSAGFGEAGDVFVVRVIRGLTGRAKARQGVKGAGEGVVKAEEGDEGAAVVVGMEDEDDDDEREKSAERKKDD